LVGNKPQIEFFSLDFAQHAINSRQLARCSPLGGEHVGGLANFAHCLAKLPVTSNQLPRVRK
jgi:hypothetical protein